MRETMRERWSNWLLIFGAQALPEMGPNLGRGSYRWPSSGGGF